MGTAWSVCRTGAVKDGTPDPGPISFAVARTLDGSRGLFGHGTCVEGNTATHWYRGPGRLLRSDHCEVFFHCACGQSDGPDSLAATAAGLPEQDRKPYPGWTA